MRLNKIVQKRSIFAPYLQIIPNTQIRIQDVTETINHTFEVVISLILR